MTKFSSRLDKVAELLDDAWEAGYEAGYDDANRDAVEAAREAAFKYDADFGWDIFDDITDTIDDYVDPEDERRAYEAERAYDEAYYDPFTRDLDWRYWDKVLVG